MTILKVYTINCISGKISWCLYRKHLSEWSKNPASESVAFTLPFDRDQHIWQESDLGFLCGTSLVVYVARAVRSPPACVCFQSSAEKRIFSQNVKLYIEFKSRWGFRLMNAPLVFFKGVLSFSPSTSFCPLTSVSQNPVRSSALSEWKQVCTTERGDSSFISRLGRNRNLS